MHVVHKHKRKKNIYIYIIIIGIIIIFLNPFNILGAMRSMSSVIFLPFNVIGQSIGSSVRNSFGVITHMSHMYEQNQTLSQEVQQLRSQVAIFTDVQNENDVLRTALDLLPRNNFTLTHAEVVTRDSLGGDQWVMVNKGSKDGVETDMAVIVGENIFVGYIDSVDQAVSRVRLVTHPESVVNVVNAKSGAEALSRGHHGLSLIVEDIKKGDTVENGDIFMTSQIGNKFPRGLSIGAAQNVSLSDDDLFQSASITPLAQLDALRFVSIVKK